MNNDRWNGNRVMCDDRRYFNQSHKRWQRYDNARTIGILSSDQFVCRLLYMSMRYLLRDAVDNNNKTKQWTTITCWVNFHVSFINHNDTPLFKIYLFLCAQLLVNLIDAYFWPFKWCRCRMCAQVTTLGISTFRTFQEAGESLNYEVRKHFWIYEQ